MRDAGMRDAQDAVRRTHDDRTGAPDEAPMRSVLASGAGAMARGADPYRSSAGT